MGCNDVSCQKSALSLISNELTRGGHVTPFGPIVGLCWHDVING